MWDGLDATAQQSTWNRTRISIYDHAQLRYFFGVCVHPLGGRSFQSQWPISPAVAKESNREAKEFRYVVQRILNQWGL